MSHEKQQLLTLGIAIVGLLISLYLLFINIKNRSTQVSAYRMTRANQRSSKIVVILVNSEQLDGRILVKLVLFNPGSIATVIHSVTTFKSRKNPNVLFRLFKPFVLYEVEDAYWWPTRDADQKKPRFLEDEYRNLYFEDFRVVLISIPEWAEIGSFEFRICTNNDYIHLKTYVDGVTGDRRFSHHFEEWYAEK